MGYTHYYPIDKHGDQAVWTRAVMAAAKIIRESPVALGDNAGTGAGPEFSDDAILFNGRSDQQCAAAVCDYCGGTSHPRYAEYVRGGWTPHDFSHETMVVPTVLALIQEAEWRKGENPVFFFCKTARKPYDLVVTAVLATLEHYAPQIIEVSSDGDPTNWVAGIQLARQVTGDATISLPRRLACVNRDDYSDDYRTYYTAAVQDLRVAQDALA